MIYELRHVLDFLYKLLTIFFDNVIFRMIFLLVPQSRHYKYSNYTITQY